MNTTMTLATNLHISPFEIFAQDTDEVIMLINFYLLKAKHSDGKQITNAKIPKTPDKNVRIRVNDKTATNGWY